MTEFIRVGPPPSAGAAWNPEGGCPTSKNVRSSFCLSDFRTAPHGVLDGSLRDALSSVRGGPPMATAHLPPHQSDRAGRIDQDRISSAPHGTTSTGSPNDSPPIPMPNTSTRPSTPSATQSIASALRTSRPLLQEHQTCRPIAISGRAACRWGHPSPSHDAGAWAMFALPGPSGARPRHFRDASPSQPDDLFRGGKGGRVPVETALETIGFLRIVKERVAGSSLN